LLTDIPEDVSEYRDESSLYADDDFCPAGDEPSSSSEDESQDITRSMYLMPMELSWLYFCVFQLVFVVFMLANRYPSTSGLQSDLELMRTMIQC